MTVSYAVCDSGEPIKNNFVGDISCFIIKFPCNNSYRLGAALSIHAVSFCSNTLKLYLHFKISLISIGFL